MNMLSHEIKANFKNTLIWAGSIALVAILFLSLFPSFSNNAEELKKVLMDYPEVVRKALGFSIDTISTLPGYYGYIFLYIILTGAIQAMNLGLGIISKELRNKTADFLLTKPVSRSSILSAKILAALSSILITNIIYLVVANVIARMVSPGYDVKIFNLISGSLFFVQLIFLTIGVFTAVAFQKIKSTIGISFATVFSFFIINVFSQTSDAAKNLQYITPFQYFNPSYIAKNSSYEGIYLVIEIIFIVTALIASYITYFKKDVDAV